MDRNNTIHLQVAPALLHQLEQKAVRSGLPVDAYAARVLERYAAKPLEQRTQKSGRG